MENSKLVSGLKKQLKSATNNIKKCLVEFTCEKIRVKKDHG